MEKQTENVLRLSYCGLEREGHVLLDFGYCECFLDSNMAVSLLAQLTAYFGGDELCVRGNDGCMPGIMCAGGRERHSVLFVFGLNHFHVLGEDARTIRDQLEMIHAGNRAAWDNARDPHCGEAAQYWQARHSGWSRVEGFPGGDDSEVLVRMPKT